MYVSLSLPPKISVLQIVFIFFILFYILKLPSLKKKIQDCFSLSAWILKKYFRSIVSLKSLSLYHSFHNNAASSLTYGVIGVSRWHASSLSCMHCHLFTLQFCLGLSFCQLIRRSSKQTLNTFKKKKKKSYLF